MQTQNPIDTFITIESAAQLGAFGMNPIATPTDAQCKAGNYKIGRIRLYDLPIAIEQPRHSYRTGIDLKTGKRWTNRLAAHYGFFSGTKGNDGDPVDCFVGVYPQAEHVYVINQYVDGRFDEHKVMLAMPDEQSARNAYLNSYDRGWPGLKSMIKATINQFKWWLKNGNMTKPLAPEHLPFDGIDTMKRIYWDSATAQPEGMTLDQLLYQVRKSDSGDNLLLDSVSMADILEEADEVATFDALVTPYAKLQRKMETLKTVMEREGDTIKPLAVQISDPFKQNGVAQVAALFELSDGQTVSIYFHNPDVDPRKIQQSDELISWKWLINKLDCTILVAPERGNDLNIREVARRIIKLAEKNSPAFQRANSKRAEKMQAIQDLNDEIVVLEKELKDAQHELEIAKIEAEDRLNKPVIDPVVDPATSPVNYSVKVTFADEDARPTFGDQQACYAEWKYEGTSHHVSFVAASAYDKKEFGLGVFRAGKGEMQEEVIAKIDPKGMKLYFVDNQHYVDTDEVKWDTPVKLTKLVIYNKALFERAYVADPEETESQPVIEPEQADPNDMRGLAFAIEKDGVLITSGSVPKLIEKSEITDIDYYKKMADQAGGNLYIGGITSENPDDPSGLIFGMTWEELKARQQRQYKPDTVKSKMPADAVMVYSAQPAADPEPETNPHQAHIDTLQSIVDGQHDGDDLAALLDVIETASNSLINAGLEKQYESLMSSAIDKWVALDQKANG
jgi:hypothetical protein